MHIQLINRIHKHTFYASFIKVIMYSASIVTSAPAENHCCELERIIKADVTALFCGRNHYKYKELCAIGNYYGYELCILIFTCGECKLGNWHICRVSW